MPSNYLIYTIHSYFPLMYAFVGCFISFLVFIALNSPHLPVLCYFAHPAFLGLKDASSYSLHS